MCVLDQRRVAFENQYAHEHWLEFKAQARRNKMLGLWLSREMGVSGEQAEDYADSILREGVQNADQTDLIAKVRNLLTAAGRRLSDAQIERRLERYMTLARTHVQTMA